MQRRPARLYPQRDAWLRKEAEISVLCSLILGMEFAHLNIAPIKCLFVQGRWLSVNPRRQVLGRRRATKQHRQFRQLAHQFARSCAREIIAL